MRVARKLFRDASLLSVIIIGLLLLFLLEAILLNVKSTGDVIQVGRPEDAVIIVDHGQPKPEPLKPVVLDPKTQCWLSHGFKPEDFAVLGDLLKNTPCDALGERRYVTATVKNNCLDIKTGNDATTNICVKDQTPSLSLAFPTPGQPVDIPVVKKNYWMALFIFIAAILLLFVWGRTDIRYFQYRTRARKNYTRLLPGREEVEIRYIKLPPAYLKKHAEQAEHKTIVKIQARTLEPQPVKQAAAQKLEQQNILQSPLNKDLVLFNTQTQLLCELLAEKKFTEAEQQYPEVYRLALRLYPLVSLENQQRLLKVVTMLHQQLKNVRKAYTVAQQVKQVYQYEQPKEVYQPKTWQPAPETMPKEELRHLDTELTKLRQLLEGSSHKEAARHFRKFWH